MYIIVCVLFTFVFSLSEVCPGVFSVVFFVSLWLIRFISSIIAYFIIRVCHFMHLIDNHFLRCVLELGAELYVIGWANN